MSRGSSRTSACLSDPSGRPLARFDPRTPRRTASKHEQRRPCCISHTNRQLRAREREKREERREKREERERERVRERERQRCAAHRFKDRPAGGAACVREGPLQVAALHEESKPIWTVAVLANELQPGVPVCIVTASIAISKESRLTRMAETTNRGCHVGRAREHAGDLGATVAPDWNPQRRAVGRTVRREASRLTVFRVGAAHSVHGVERRSCTLSAGSCCVRSSCAVLMMQIPALSALWIGQITTAQLSTSGSIFAHDHLRGWWNVRRSTRACPNLVGAMLDRKVCNYLRNMFDLVI